ncbi:hypothetical protein GE061_018164 [Apolygus lucorum]|uniref:Uncharacterized protein n=1 Tax=Apolygus lucorum TaxID=248454 RepID=A0A6A4JC07_APOLU|nr:hypothetical protein GE061_018164 [Apolygus lucorum]
MDFLLPNEIARLVYGYLEEEQCTSAAKLFLETSSHLKECVNMAVKGRRFNTKVLGMGLIEILDLLAEVTCYIQSVERGASTNDLTLAEFIHQLRVTLKIGSAGHTADKPVYLRITVPSRPKKKKSKTPDVSPSHPKVVHDGSQKSLEDSSESSVSQSHALQLLLENKALHQKLAENINKVVANKSDADSLERILEKKIVETIVNTTEKDPIFQEMLEELVGPVGTTSSTPEDTEVENEDVAARLQSGAGVSQQIHTSGSNIVTTAMAGLGIVTGSVNISPQQMQSGLMTGSLSSYQMSSGVMTGGVPVQSHTTGALTAGVPVSTHPMLYGTTTPTLASHLTQPTFPLVNSPGFQPGLPHGPGYDALVSPAIPSLSPQCAPGQSYVITATPGKATLNSTISPGLPGSSSGSSSHPVPAAIIPASVVPPTAPRYRSIQSKPPMQSTIKVLHPVSNQPRPSTVNIITSNPSGSVLEGLLKLSVPVGSPKTTQGTLASFSLATTASSSRVVRVSGVRTRGGKPRVLKTYGSAKKVQIERSNTPTLKSKPSEERIEREPQIPAPSICEQLISTEPNGKAETIPETCSVETTRKSVESTDKEVEESNVPEPQVEVNTTSTTDGSSIVPERPDATPQQAEEPKVKLRKRLSLSTPRKGSHVRTLEFKTPPKGSSMPRKSASSPKNKVPGRLPQMHKMLQSVKKSELFKSPPKKKEAKSWDADLRAVVSNPCEDVPTSVGLRRKEPDELRNRRKKTPSKIETVSQPVPSSKTETTSIAETSLHSESSPNKAEFSGKSETNEDLVTRIQREVLDVIDEEDFSDINSNNKSLDCTDSPKTKSPVKSPCTGSLLEIGDIGVPSSTIKKLYSKRLPPGDENSSTVDSFISKVPRENISVSPPRPQTPSSFVGTPSKIGMSPEKSLPNTPGSASLEATLIKECSRIENEGMERAQEGLSIFGSYKDFVSGKNSPVESPTVTKNTEDGAAIETAPLLPPPKGILVLKTPAKSTLPVPVEMTPLSKIINEETRLGKCTLLTPTIPPTPDHEELKSLNPANATGSPSPIAASSHAKKSPTNISPKTPLKKATKTPKLPENEEEESPHLSNTLDRSSGTQSLSGACSSVSVSQTNVSPKTPSKRAMKTPTKTPQVRLRTKESKHTNSKTKTISKKKDKTEIDRNELIAQCLQRVKASVYGSSIPDSEDDSSQPAKLPEKKSPGTKKLASKKKKSTEKRKPKVDESIEPKKPETSKLNFTRPTFSEIIERYEGQDHDSGSSSNDAIEVAKLKSNIVKNNRDLRDSQNNPRQPQIDQVSKVCKVDNVVGVPEPNVSNTKNPTDESKKYPAENIVDIPEVCGIESPAASPPHAANERRVKVSAEKVDLDSYGFAYTIETLNNEMINKIIRPSPFLDIYSYPPVSVLTKPNSEHAKPAISDGVVRGDVLENSRRRRRSDSDEEDEYKDRKRKRVERTYENRSRPSPLKRGRGRPSRHMISDRRRGRGIHESGLSKRGGGRSPQKRYGSPAWKDRRPSRKYSGSSDEDKRGRSKSNSRRSSPYSRDHSRSRYDSECDMIQSPDRNRFSKKHEERPSRRLGRKYSESSDEDERQPRKLSRSRTRTSSYTRERSRLRAEVDSDVRSADQNQSSKKREESSAKRERPKTPSNDSRRGERSPREHLTRKSSRMDSQVSRIRQEVRTERAQLPSALAEPPPARRPEKTDLLPPVREKSKLDVLNKRHELEEGEISDTSRSTILSISRKTSHFFESSAARLCSPAADENRQALLLKGVNLDVFLDKIHGEDKSNTQ